ncbi:MAG: tyrosine-type recombinase/integrase [Candidatus Nanopelagicales bacterium]
MDVASVTDEMRLLWQDLESASEVRSESRASATRVSYGYHVKGFLAWCEQRGVQPLPAAPETVAAHVAWYVLEHDVAGFPVRAGDGRPVQRVTMASVSSRVAAINKLHEYARLPRPGESEVVRETMHGVARTFGSRARSPRLAIELDALAQVVAEVERREFVGVRNAFAVLLRGKGFTAGELARMTWAHIQVDEGASRVEVRVPVRDASVRVRRAVLRPVKVRGVPGHTGVVDPVGLVARLRAWAPVGSAHLMVKPDGVVLGRHSVMALVEAAASGVGGFGGLPGCAPRDVATAALTGLDAGSAVAVRDAAIVLTGWYAALRRSMIVGLNWEDVQFDDGDGLVTLLIRRSKTDQAGQGSLSYLPRVELGDDPCPFAALARWRDVYARVAGVPPSALSGPVFPRLTRGGTVRRDNGGVVRRLDGSAVNTIVGDAATAAGLPVPPGESGYGAHSLRAGFITTALRDDALSIPEVSDVSGHRDPRILMRYRREVNAPRDNPARKLLDRRKPPGDGDGGGGGGGSAG